MPDPNYTWVPRSRVQQPPATVTVTPTPTTTAPPTPTTTLPVPTDDRTARRRSVLPTPPCLLPPPFCPPSTSPTAVSAAATAAGARSGADFAATGQLTSLASEIHGYTGVP